MAHKLEAIRHSQDLLALGEAEQRLQAAFGSRPALETPTRDKQLVTVSLSILLRHHQYTSSHLEPSARRHVRPI